MCGLARKCICLGERFRVGSCAKELISVVDEAMNSNLSQTFACVFLKECFLAAILHEGTDISSRSSDRVESFPRSRGQLLLLDEVHCDFATAFRSSASS